MSSPRTALRERVAALGSARRAIAAGRIDDAETVLREELERWPGNRDAQALLAEVTRARGGTPGIRPGGRVQPAVPRVRRSTAEAWSSFEQRIRERRIAKSAEHARAAVQAGDAAAALGSIDEIETLVPGHPLLDELGALLREHGIDVDRVRAPNEPQIADRPPADEAGQQGPAAGSDQPEMASRAVALDAPDTPPTDVTVPRVVPPATLHRAAAHTLDPHAPPSAVPAPSTSHDPLELFTDHAPSAIGEVPFHADQMRRDQMRRDAPPDDVRSSDPRLRANPESAPPLRERGTHVLGILLVLLSVIALSGWLGYRLFRPVGDVPLVPAGDKVADESTASAEPPPAPEPEAPRTGDPTGTAGREDGAVASPAPEPPPPEVLSSSPSPPRIGTPQESTPPERPSTTTSREAPSASNGKPPGETARSVESTTAGPASSPPERTEPQSASEPAPQASAAGQSPVPGNTEAPPVPAPAPAQPAPPAREEPAPTSPPAAASEATTTDTTDAGKTSGQDAEALRGLIEGYVAGYNNLDAGGVRLVWPGVNQRALARAFSQLRSQRFAFSRCEVRASGDTGHGFCTGRATWRPRVGGGERTEHRVWRFDFGQRAGQWSIDKVGVER